jgi:hypothetical protein
MQLSDHKDRRHATGRTCALHLDERTAQAVDVALDRAALALESGRLLSPGEALALAGRDAREKETLFSIARDVAWETGGDVTDILCKLGERYPVYA